MVRRLEEIMTFAEQYRDLLAETARYGVSELNRRTGVEVTALPQGASLVIGLNDGILPTCGLRKTKPHIAAAEVAWCFLGHNHIDWLRRHTKVWDDFADVTDCALCDGCGTVDATAELVQNMGKTICSSCRGSGKIYWLDASYGYRWRQKFGIDQLQVALSRLRNDSSDRRCWISSWDPSVDIEARGQKTVPCPVGFTLSVLGGRLNSTLMIRSSDLYMGLPYDVMRHALVMAACAATLGVDLGFMRVSLAHPHIYATQCENVLKMLDAEIVVPALPMPECAVNWIVERPDEYVGAYKDAASRVKWPALDPKSEVVR